MSMILEALRKSEAERQRGRAPGLFVEQQPARLRDRRVPPWAWASVALLVALLLGLAWREWQRPALVVVTTAAPSPDTVTEARPTQIAPRTEPAPGATGSLPPITLAPTASPPDVAATPPVAAPDPDPTQSATAPPRSEAIGAPAPEPAPVAPPPAETVADLPGLETLAAADRTALPPLKLSMHVYADTPAQRFVILDGQRLGEGASPATGVVLEEIRRDGLVLSVNGQRLLLARP
jgi:general secretion pathway protein B